MCPTFVIFSNGDDSQTVEFTDEELAVISAKASALGFDLETYLRVRTVSGGDLPEPGTFFELVGRLDNFAKDYRAHLHALAERQPGAPKRTDLLAADFGRLLQQWDELYGPRP